jgi:hypothetical protein
MKTRIMLGALIMAAVIGSSVGVGYAGGGAGGGPGGVILYQCYEVNQGSALPHRLSINDQFTDDTPKRVGKPKLLCAPTDWSVLNEVDIDVSAVGEHITCYEVSGVQETTSVVLLNDVFSAPSGGQQVKVQGPSKFVCVFATKECVSGGCLVHGGQ